MAGSRKGERRGGKRKGQPREPRFDASTGTIKPKGGRPKGSLSGQSLITGEREREMIEIITGKSELMPKDVQLNSMRTLYGLAMEYQATMRVNIRTIPSDDAHAARLNAAVDYAESKMVQYLMLSSQVARDVAPFIHPRLAALAVTTDRNTEGDLFDLLLKEINDETPRLKVINHDPRETPRQQDEEAA